tara:strand:- start:4758 stop:5885 length:1128 start_codon:yes stop_codon:yes gene_type:complete
LITVVYKTIKDVEPAFLKIINPLKNVYFSKKLLLSFEISNPNIEMKYICVYDNDKPQALAIVQTVKLSLDVILKNIKITKLSRWLLNLLFCEDHIKIMFCGNIFLSGEYAIGIVDEKKWMGIIKYVCKSLDSISKSIKPLHAIFIKDFYTKTNKTKVGFKNFSYTQISVEPNMIVKIESEWKCFDDYKNALKSKYRIKVNKADSKSRKLISKFFTADDIKKHQKDLQILYQNTIKNANFNAQVLNLNTYVYLKSAFNNEFIVKGYFLKNKIVGFLSALKNASNLDAHFIGLDYSLNKDYAIYPRILNDYIRLGIEKKVSQINLGRTASEIKTTIGAKPYELVCYIKHKNQLINLLIKPFLKRIEIKSFKQHLPFK